MLFATLSSFNFYCIGYHSVHATATQTLHTDLNTGGFNLIDLTFGTFTYKLDCIVMLVNVDPIPFKKPTKMNLRAVLVALYSPKLPASLKAKPIFCR
jgi:hypothetical protein